MAVNTAFHTSNLHSIATERNLYSDLIRDKIAYRIPNCPPTSKEFFKGYFKEVFNYWDERKRKINMLADKSPTMYEYLKKNIYK